MAQQQDCVALKEWAVAVRALAEGKQTLIMRKGGIAEETADFELESESFYLYPTYEHQKERLVRDEFLGDLAATLEGWSPEQRTVAISVYAEAAADFEVEEQSDIDRLRDFHIWTDAFTEERLHWKKKKPLHVIVLRVYRLEAPVLVPVLDEYAGCKSWVRLRDPIPDVKKVPVLTDEQFGRRLGIIRQALGR